MMDHLETTLPLWQNVRMEEFAMQTETRRVRFGDVDRSDRLTFSAAFGFFQDVAIDHAEALGVGREAMAGSGRAWILARMSVRVDRRPAFTETLRVRSWPRALDRLFTLRDFDILDENGDRVIRARSGWLVIDPEKRRPLRPDPVMEGIPLGTVDALPFPPPQLAPQPEMTELWRHRVGYDDLDFNGHVNNISYIRWTENALDARLPGGLRLVETGRLDVNYMSEVLPGEAVGIFLRELPSEGAGPAFAVEGRKDDGQPAFRAEFRSPRVPS